MPMSVVLKYRGSSIDRRVGNVQSEFSVRWYSRPLRICSTLIISLALALSPMSAQSPSDAFEAGRAADLAGDYDTAIPQLERAIELDESNAGYHYWLGRAVYEATPRASKLRMPGMARRVRKEWERAVALDPNQIDARRGLTEYYAMAPAFISHHENNWAAEVQAYEQAIALAPDTTAAYVALADAYVGANQIDSAFITIARYATRRSTDPWRLYYFGRLSGTTGQRLDEGQQALRQFLAVPVPNLTAPGLSRAHYWVGKIAERGGNDQLAREHYKTALQTNPTNHAAKKALEALK
jgi:tetratricopeptide (TPR) repeat protein